MNESLDVKYCMICGFPDPDRHHIKTRGSGGSDEDFNILNICRIHHIEIHNIGNYEFCKKHPIIMEILDEKGWKFVGRKLRRK